MLRLEFSDFQEKIKQDSLVNHVPTVHCMINETGFLFVMKSREKWDYYSIMTFDMIEQFAQENNIDPVEAFNMFMTNYCTNTLKILPPEVVVEVIEEIEAPVEELSEDVFKKYCQNNSHVASVSATTTSPPSTKKTSSETINPGEDLIDAAENYSDFLLRFFDSLEKSSLRAVDKIEQKSFTVNKTIGEFLRDMFNHINTIAFATQVRRFIKQDLIGGLESAESELDIDIGFTDEFQDKVNQLAHQQIDGYMINGRKWPGIKGVTKEIQAKIIQTVQNGINEELSLKDIKENIQKDFSKFSDWRSNMIARTETTRITNEGKILGYRESGLDGMKVWSATKPRGCPRCSAICDRLDGQAVPLNQDFVDLETKKRYFAPPGHTNCRSTVFFRPFSKNQSSV
jgi:SPP1 gp7 family putative phage head morphogenesis protein